MTAKRELLIIVAVLATAAAVFGGLILLLPFLFDVLGMSVSSAGFSSLVIFILTKLVLLTCPVLAAIFVAKKLRPRREEKQGFELVSSTPNVPGRLDAPPAEDRIAR